MTALQDGDVRVGLVGQDRLEAVPVMVGERQLGAGVWTFAAVDHPRSRRPGAEIDVSGELDDLPVLALGAVLIQGRDPSAIRGLEDRGANLLGQLIAKREPQIAPPAVIGGPVRRPGRISPDEDRERLELLLGDLRERPVNHRDVIGGSVRSGVPRTQHDRQRLAGLVRIGAQRVKPVPML